MPVHMYTIVIDAKDPLALGQFWAELLGQSVLLAEDNEVIVGADDHAFPGMCFLPTKDEKTIKNRLRIDLVPDDFDAEVERIIKLGARPIDKLQVPGADWVVLADPEGNEFCILPPHESLTDLAGQGRDRRAAAWTRVPRFRRCAANAGTGTPGHGIRLAGIRSAARSHP